MAAGRGSARGAFSLMSGVMLHWSIYWSSTRIIAVTVNNR